MAFEVGDKVRVLTSTHASGTPHTPSQWMVGKIGTVTKILDTDEFPYKVECNDVPEGAEDGFLFRESDLAKPAFTTTANVASGTLTSRYIADTIFRVKTNAYSFNPFYERYNEVQSQPITERTTTMSSSNDKFYQTIQDLPTIEKGAILKSSYGEYKLVDSLWAKANAEEHLDEVRIAAWNVEGSPDFYTRVYKIPGTDTYGTKEQALAAIVKSATPTAEA